VTTGAGTLTLGGNVTLNANGAGTTGATVSGNVASAVTSVHRTMARPRMTSPFLP
jgi:hypothetical protein